MIEETRKINRNPSYKQIEQKFKLEYEDSEIEKRKLHLKSLRDLHKPINHDELLEHSKKMEELTKEKLEKRKTERMA